MTERPKARSDPDTPALMRATPLPHQAQKARTHTTSPDNRTSLRRTGSPSRPSGRSAVGLRPSPDTDPWFGVLKHLVGTGKRGPATTLDRPRPFRDDLQERRTPGNFRTHSAQPPEYIRGLSDTVGPPRSAN